MFPVIRWDFPDSVRIPDNCVLPDGEWWKSLEGCRHGEGVWLVLNDPDAGYTAVLMQFTGLTDKNGREIYEGDIVKAHGAAGINVIVWDERGCFILKGSVERGAFYLDDFIIQPEPYKPEVIGNIHEHPELLK